LILIEAAKINNLASIGITLVISLSNQKSRDMKKALIAASIVGAAAAGVILYLANRSRAEQLLDNLNDTVEDLTDRADEGRRIAKNHLRKTRKKVNHMIHDHMS
jgi:uncharacterized membrane-anchored protein YhcB (DUF1043 family)